MQDPDFDMLESFQYFMAGSIDQYCEDCLNVLGSKVESTIHHFENEEI